MAYSITCFVIDVSPGMAEEVYDEETMRTVSKLDLCKEYVCRKIASKVQSGRKTEHAGVLTFGGETDNPFFAKSGSSAPEAVAHDPQDYVGVASIFPPQQARPQMLGVVGSIKIGHFNGNPMAALIVTDEILKQHPNHNRASKNWKKEVVLLTYAQAKVKQIGWEIVLNLMKNRGVLFKVIGVDFDNRSTEDIPDEEFPNLPKIERFWRKFCDQIREELTEEDKFLMPQLGRVQDALSAVRGPVLEGTGSLLAKSIFRIGSTDIDPEEAIEFTVRHSKATAIAHPQTLKKVIASQVARPKTLSESVIPSHSQASRASQSYGQLNGVGRASASTIAGTAGIEADVSAFTKYFILKKIQTEGDDENIEDTQARRIVDEDEDDDMEPEYEEIEVDQEDLTKAYRFGSTWVPLNDEDFETMETTAGFEVLGFFRATALQRQHLMGEVMYIWPDPDDQKSQVQLSAIVQALKEKDGLAVVRYVWRDGRDPKLGVVKPMIFDNEEGHIECLHWVQMPFAEDEKRFFFPSLTDLKSKSGKPITEHRLLPTEEQDSLMHDLVDEMDLDSLGDPEKDDPWYDCSESYNPAIHRLREAVYHLATTADLNSNPVPPPHPSLLRYVDPPSQIVDLSYETVQQLKTALDIKAAPPPKKKFERKPAGTDAREDLDIDALFANGTDSPTKPKKEETSPATNVNGKRRSPHQAQNSPSSKSLVNHGSEKRVIGRQDPVGDFNRIISESSGNEIMEKAMEDLGEIIKENLKNSFSKAGFTKALECLRIMRRQALTYEMTEEYNIYIQGFERFCKDPEFKHRDFWNEFENAKPPLGNISVAEAESALLVDQYT